MASIGSILKKEREKKKITLEQVSEDTKISTKYLKAIETDDYTIFPGETYIIGFIRNYARSIGLDPVDIIRQYKAMKMESSISEKEEVPYLNEVILEKEIEKKKEEKERKQPKIKKSKKEDIDIIEISDEEIEDITKTKTKKKKKKDEPIIPAPIKEKKKINPLYFLIGGGSIIVLVGIFFIVKLIVSSLSSVEQKEIVTNLEEIKLLTFTDNLLHYDFSINEYYKIKLGNKTHTILFEKLTPPVDVNSQNQKNFEEFAFHLDDVIIQLKKGDLKKFDFDLDGKKDLSVKIDGVNNDIVTATIIKLHSFIVATNGTSNTNQNLLTKNSNSNKVENKNSNENKGKLKKGKIMFTAIVKEKTYIKAFLDGKEQEGVIYYPNQKVHLEANDVIQLKIGNAGGIVAKINGKPVKLGKRGEIANKIIKWERDPYDENAYNLVIKDWQ